ncbi:carotenoid isomerase [Chloropicon primus]|uniref:prolycopene isomerase n=2 Tax=Chloropicon primus TaxID=1764295 RepID=A0A5B8MS07_9CHLO|nr:carotenoid isomerase [Chloropicon primus]UPR01918.1 carotenoid isomerase [Chloropicon primus]|eukprot:QDZ22694.1 carotenoid isomerase [Chloropicon primus]
MAVVGASKLRTSGGTRWQSRGRRVQCHASPSGTTAESSSPSPSPSSSSSSARTLRARREEVVLESSKGKVWDAIVVGSGMGGLTTAAKMVAKGADVLVLEKYVIPGGSAGYYQREGCTFDVGSSMMFGFGTEGTTNLLTRALESVGKKMETIPDPAQIHYHLPSSRAHPDGLKVVVHRRYEEFVDELASKFPHEREGIEKFYGDCWTVFDALNSLDLKSLEEPLYLFGEFFKNPVACLQLAYFLPQNAGDIARKYIQDEELLSFIDMECYCWSTVKAAVTPMINAGMVFCDRHYGGINYPRGGVGRIPLVMAEGIEEKGGKVVCAANVSRILTERGGGGGGEEGSKVKAVGVELSDGTRLRSRAVISNATRWDTFKQLVEEGDVPQSEVDFFKRYKKSPSFITAHIVVEPSVVTESCYCHNIVLEDWAKLEDGRGTLFVSIPTILDPSLAPEGRHIVHAFTPDWIDSWSGLSKEEYAEKKEAVAREMIARLEEAFLPGLSEAVVFKEVGTPRTHMKFLNRQDGTYGPIPSKRPLGLLGMPFNRTDVESLYCVGDSTFPGQGVNAVAFSGFACAHRALADLDLEPRNEVMDRGMQGLFAFLRGLV